jgi:hypothetical protein
MREIEQKSTSTRHPLDGYFSHSRNLYTLSNYLYKYIDRGAWLWYYGLVGG